MQDHWTEPRFGLAILPALSHEHIYAVVLDLYSRKCIVWVLSRNIDRQSAMNALDKAIENRWSESTQGPCSSF